MSDDDPREQAIRLRWSFVAETSQTAEDIAYLLSALSSSRQLKDRAFMASRSWEEVAGELRQELASSRSREQALLARLERQMAAVQELLLAREAAWRDAGEFDLANECANILHKIRRVASETNARQITTPEEATKALREIGNTWARTGEAPRAGEEEP